MWALLALVVARAGVEGAVDRVLEEGSTSESLDGDVLFAAGMRLWRQGDTAALEWFERVPATSDRWPLAALLRARALRRGDQLRLAAALAQDVLDWQGEARDPAVLEEVKNLAYIDLGALYADLDPAKALGFYLQVPNGSGVVALARARAAQLEHRRGKPKRVERLLAGIPVDAAFFPEAAAIEAELAASGCTKRTTAVPQAIVDAEAATRAHQQALGKADGLAGIPEGRVDLRVASDLPRLYAEADEARAAGEADLADRLELDAEVWTRIQLDLESSRTERALGRIRAATASCTR